MKNVKFKLMAAVLCLTVGFAFAGCNAATEETTKEETTTTTTEATTTTEEETTTTEEETEVSLDEDDMGFEMPDSASAEDFEVEGVAAAAQECIDNGMELYAIPADQFDSEVEIDEDTYIEGFMAVGGSLSVHVDTEEEESSAEADGFTMVQCAAFTTYEDALAYANEMLASASENDGIEIETEETDDGLTFSGSADYYDEGSMELTGYVTPEGVFCFEASITM